MSLFTKKMEYPFKRTYYIYLISSLYFSILYYQFTGCKMSAMRKLLANLILADHKNQFSISGV